MFSQESEILRKLRLIESLKAELVSNAGALLGAIAKNSEAAITEGLAAVIISTYVLARRLGINGTTLDQAIDVKLSQNIKKEHDAEKWFGDFSECQRHFRQKRC